MTSEKHNKTSTVLTQKCIAHNASGSRLHVLHYMIKSSYMCRLCNNDILMHMYCRTYIMYQYVVQIVRRVAAIVPSSHVQSISFRCSYMQSINFRCFHTQHTSNTQARIRLLRHSPLAIYMEQYKTTRIDRNHMTITRTSSKRQHKRYKATEKLVNYIT